MALRYIDAAAVQFRDTNADGTLDQTLIFLHDGNYNVTAVLDAGTGDILERYSYDAYGQHTVHDAAWNLVGTTSTIGNHLLYAGYQFDSDTGLHLARNRYYHSSLGTWLTRDPMGYVDGMNVYQYVGGNAVNASDPSGLAKLLTRGMAPAGWTGKKTGSSGKSGHGNVVHSAVVIERSSSRPIVASFEGKGWVVMSLDRYLSLNSDRDIYLTNVRDADDEKIWCAFVHKYWGKEDAYDALTNNCAINARAILAEGSNDVHSIPQCTLPTQLRNALKGLGNEEQYIPKK